MSGRNSPRRSGTDNKDRRFLFFVCGAAAYSLQSADIATLTKRARRTAEPTSSPRKEKKMHAASPPFGRLADTAAGSRGCCVLKPHLKTISKRGRRRRSSLGTKRRLRRKELLRHGRDVLRQILKRAIGEALPRSFV